MTRPAEGQIEESRRNRKRGKKKLTEGKKVAFVNTREKGEADERRN